MKQKIKQATHNIYSKLSFRIYKPTLFSVFTLLIIIPCGLFLPEKFAWENSYIENFQTIALISMFIIALKSKENKKFFNFIAMFSIVLILREINYGRAFFPLEGQINTFKTWKEILPDFPKIPVTMYACFMIYTLYYFFKNKLFKDIIEIYKNNKIDVINPIIIIISILTGHIAENNFHNMVAEETAELCFYISLTVFIYLYSNKYFKIKE